VLGDPAHRPAQLARALGSAGARSDGCGSSLAGSADPLHQTELRHQVGPWRGREDPKYPGLERLGWFTGLRPPGERETAPPTEFAAAHNHERPRRGRVYHPNQRFGTSWAVQIDLQSG